MRNNSRYWFRFAGKDSMEVGAWLKSAPAFVRPTWRGDALVAIGRSGDIFSTDNSYDSYDLKVTVRTHVSKMDAVISWLSGAGMLMFSWSQDRECYARIVKTYEWNFVAPGRDPIIEAEVIFRCQPWYYILPEPAPIEITTNNTDIYNPGNVAALPIVTIVGSGTFNVFIGEQVIQFTDITDGIVLNSELGDAYSLDEQTNLNNNIYGDLWAIQPGENTVRWTSIDTFTLTSITILPKWRYRA